MNVVYGVNKPAIYADVGVIGGGGNLNATVVPTFRIRYDEPTTTINLDFTPSALIIHSIYRTGGARSADCRSFVTQDSSSGLYYNYGSIFFDKMPSQYDIYVYRDGSRSVGKEVNIIENGIKIDNSFNTLVDIEVSIIALK